MRTYIVYRSAAPRRSRAAAWTQVGGIPAPGWLLWLIGAALAASLVALVTAASARAQTPGASAQSAAEYVQQAARHDLLAIRASRVALQRSHDPAVRRFAQQMLDDHARSSSRLKQALRDARMHMNVPMSLDARDQQAIGDLQHKSADEFDAAYLQSQLITARNALDLQRAYAQAGDNPALKRFADEATPTVERHLAALEVLAQQNLAARMCEAPAASARDRAA